MLTAKFGDMKIESGDHLSYLNMVFNVSHPTQLIVSMTEYKRALVSGLSLPHVNTPGTIDFAHHQPDSPPLNEDAKSFFHTYVAKCLYLHTHLHGEIGFYVNFLAQRVQNPTEADLKKLYHLLGYIKSVCNDVLTLDATSFADPKFYIDASFATNPDFKSQSGLVCFFGRGSFLCQSGKQSINSKSTAESELVAMSDKASVALGLIQIL
jgi:hypothetical protein